ncbi:MAG: hypothetical protein KAJ28_02205, partial [Flavobacteriaceae bacterium]|nr:hypothetical protein [Flavobacteriaceae bacterium]
MDSFLSGLFYFCSDNLNVFIYKLIMERLTKKERFKKVIAYFDEHMPVAETELTYKSAYELLVAVILSAQCTDVRVNMLTPAFFKSF